MLAIDLRLIYGDSVSKNTSTYPFPPDHISRFRFHAKAHTNPNEWIKGPNRIRVNWHPNYICFSDRSVARGFIYRDKYKFSIFRLCRFYWRLHFINLLVSGEKQSTLFGDHEMLFFNISAVTGDEEITRARLHLHRRRITKPYPQNRDRQLLPTPSRVVFYQTRSMDAKPRKLGHISVSAQSLGGWAPPLDITPILREIHGRSLLLGVRFEGPKGVHLTINNFLKRKKTKQSKSSLAYLIVLSKSDLQEGLDEPKERHLKHKERKIDNNELSNDISQNSEVRHKSKHKVYQVRRTKEAEQELRRRTHLQSLPFLHVNEVADMRRSLRKAKRSIDVGNARVQPHHFTHHKKVCS